MEYIEFCIFVAKMNYHEIFSNTSHRYSNNFISVGNHIYKYRLFFFCAYKRKSVCR
ncbi:hypothetical protein HMPREF1173_02228 [Prevotella nigrescens CC14M]|uniref:Uncharacterized protein n=1 Tax=Prevotella nigrescens CC14M TaxID=1073366 RepID=V8CGF5_9BACT|nr:hypothetical protein HMPREF1173_02228 [Prevotella nigrescens CC14M]